MKLLIAILILLSSLPAIAQPAVADKKNKVIKSMITKTYNAKLENGEFQKATSPNTVMQENYDPGEYLLSVLQYNYDGELFSTTSLVRNEKKQLVQYKVTYQGAVVGENITYKYDPKGNRIESIDSLIKYTYKKYYDGKNKLIRAVGYDNYSVLDETQVYNYNIPEQSLTVNYFNPQNVLYRKLFYKYDKDENPLERIDYDKGDIVFNKTISKYNKNNDIIEDNVVGAWTSIFQYDYNLNNNWVKRTKTIYFKNPVFETYEIVEREIAYY
jgi:hypothetical protein